MPEEDLTNAVSAEQAVELINDGLSKVVIDALTEEDIDQIVLDTLGENAAIPNLPGDSTLFYNGEGEWTSLEVDTLSAEEINRIVQEQTQDFVTSQQVIQQITQQTQNFVTSEQVGQLIDFATEDDVSAAIEQIVWSRNE